MRSVVLAVMPRVLGGATDTATPRCASSTTVTAPARGVPEVDRAVTSWSRLTEGYDATVACSPSSAEVSVVWSFVYLALRRSLELVLLCVRSTEAKEIEILVLRHELAVLRRQHPRPRLQPTDRALPAALSRPLPRVRWAIFLVHPETPLCWLRRRDLLGGLIHEHEPAA